MKIKALLLLTPFILAGCNLWQTTSKTDDVMMEDGAMTKEGDDAMMEDEAMMEGEGAMMEDSQTVTLEAKNFTFGKDEIRVKKGDTVKVTINNSQGTHDFVIDEFGVSSGIIPTGSSKTVEFVADKAGSFEYYCSVGNHRQLGMKGTLIVE